MLKFDSQGLIPAVIVDDATGEALMVAFMNSEALQLTRETGQSHFYSRSRQKIWHKGEESGNVQEVRGIFVNCEENSVLVRVVQHGDAACHEGYRSCYYRRLLPDDTYETVAERIFDPAEVYHHHTAVETEVVESSEAYVPQKLESALRQLYGIYTYLRDHDLSNESNTSRLLHEKDAAYLISRVDDELGELTGVQRGEHVHAGLQADTRLEGSQVCYWLFLLAVMNAVPFDDFGPHASLLLGYTGQYSAEKAQSVRAECLQLLTSDDPVQFAHGLRSGFAFVGWACVSAGISPLDPSDYDLAQMRKKGLIHE
ncbi:MAG TPA: phosphoribosyl-AMP cyclohydrolase [Dictyobacter sp.]|jgi:phosphoribosyl-AMP cyclohydrolase|nr:phosphoribosyl-AMP cyclohydrolase [Dictyobacter sp.]